MFKVRPNLFLMIAFVTVVILSEGYLGEKSVSEEVKKEVTETEVRVNGLSPKTLQSLADYLKENPDKGRVTFYSNARWHDGMRSFTNFAGYKVDGEMVHQKSRNFTLLGDEPTEFSATDAAPGAIEELMYALRTCIIAAANANAVFMGIKLDRLQVKLESDLDLHGLFALDPNVRPGLTD